jgi:3',5'-cyclic AMP phosphodiesterase CpdA
MKFEHLSIDSADETVIRVEGISRPYTIMHITDSHLTESDAREDEAGLKNAERRQGTFPCDEVRAKLSAAVARSNELNVDCTVFTGDIVDFPTAGNVETMQELFSRLTAPFLYTFGNHDWRFSHHPASVETRDAYTSMFAAAAGGNPLCQAFDLGGELRLITIDNSLYQISEEQLAFVREQLRTELPCLLFYHIPLALPTLMPKVIEVWKKPLVMAGERTNPDTGEELTVAEPQEATRKFCELLTGGESANLMAVFCGHVHFPHQDSFGGTKYQYIAEPCFRGGSRKITFLPV